MPHKKYKMEDYFAHMDEIRERHKRPIVPENGGVSLKDRLRLRVKNLPPAPRV